MPASIRMQLQGEPPPSFPSDLDALKRRIIARSQSEQVAAHMMASDVVELERLNPTERPAASPLIDGGWTTLWASDVPRWPRLLPLRRSMVHSLEVDYAMQPGRYAQRCRFAGLFTASVEGMCSPLGGDHLQVEFESKMHLGIGNLKLISLRIDGKSTDLDHALQPTFIDGDLCVFRTAAVSVGPSLVLRPERIYVLQRIRSATYWQPPFDEVPSTPSWLPDA